MMQNIKAPFFVAFILDISLLISIYTHEATTAYGKQCQETASYLKGLFLWNQACGIKQTMINPFTN